MTRTLSILPFLLIACTPAEETVSEQPTGERTEEVKSKSSEDKSDKKSDEAESQSPTGSSAGTMILGSNEVEEASGWQTEVVTGESLVLLSQWAGTTVEAIAELNGLDARDSIYPGQSILLPLADEAQIEEFRGARAKGSQDRLDRYLGARGGLIDVDVHVVRTGETAWNIATEQAGIPLWVLASFNEDLDLQTLGIGEHLQLPVLGDTVAELDFEEVDFIQPETIGLPVDYD